jgi:hypothetical protein
MNLSFHKSEKGIAEYLLFLKLHETIKAFKLVVDVEDERVFQSGNISGFHSLVKEKCKLDLSQRNLIGIIDQIDSQQEGLVTVFS